MSVMHISKDNFESEVLNAEGTVLVDFWASWCMPCKMMLPVVDRIADANPSVKVCKVNIDEESEIAEKYRIMTIPTLMVFKNGQPVNSMIGVNTQNDVQKMLG